HHVLGGAGLALTRGGRGRALGAAGKTESVNLADQRVPRHISEFRGDLAGGKSALPELFELLDAILTPGQYRHCILPFALSRPNGGSAGDANSQKSLRAESLSLRRARKPRPNVYAVQMDSWDQIRRTRCRTRQPRRYNMA